MFCFTSLYMVPLNIFQFKQDIFKKHSENFCNLKNLKIRNKKKIDNLLSKFRMEKKKNKIHVWFSFFLTISIFFCLFFKKNSIKTTTYSQIHVNAYSFLDKSTMAKLKSIPVFSITNKIGQPFLIQNKKGDHIGLIFFSYQEAMIFARDLEEARQATKPRIFIINLEKGFKMVCQGLSPSGLKDKYGQDYKMRFQFIPEKEQMNHAVKLAKKKGLNQRIPLLPIFTIDGLTISRRGESISPMFFAKEDLEITWNKLRKDDPSLPRNPKIIEGDFIQLILFMRLDLTNHGNNHEDSVNIKSILNFGFIPSTNSLKFIKKGGYTESSAKMIKFKKVF